VKDQDGKEVFFREKVYEVQHLHFSHNKKGYLGLSHWDITALDQIDLGIKPYETDSLVFVVPLSEGTKSAEAEAVFKFIYEEGHIVDIHREIQKVKF
jgi:ABC-type microcin C transport system duplicated ATPase subunit YejF